MRQITQVAFNAEMLQSCNNRSSFLNKGLRANDTEVTLTSKGMRAVISVESATLGAWHRADSKAMPRPLNAHLFS